MLLLLIVSLLLIGCYEEPKELREVPIEQIAKSVSSRYLEKKEVLVTNEDKMESLWQINTFGSQNPPSIPQIDFSKYAVIAVFRGEQKTGGYSIEIGKVLENKKTFDVYVNETFPGKGCVTTQVKTAPYYMIKIEKLNKTVRYIYEQRERKC